MTVGIPRALAYYRYGTLWEAFFQELGINYVLSEETHQGLIAEGLRHTVDESCLPAKLYMGHVSALVDYCDLLLVPRLYRLGKQEEFCARFWGLYDTVRLAFPRNRILSYELNSARASHEMAGFVSMGKVLGKSISATVKAYRAAKVYQQTKIDENIRGGQIRLSQSGPKILIAAQSYILHDPFIGGMVARLVREQGGMPIFVDNWEAKECLLHSSKISKDLYWIANREILGALQLARGIVDGVILLTAFPCGSDCLANELALRRVNDLPIAQIIMDEQQGSEGLQTRIESFMDMISGGKIA